MGLFYQRENKAESLEFNATLNVWRLWRLIAITAIFANACISGRISKAEEAHS